MFQVTVEIEAKLQEKSLIRTIQMFENAIDDFKRREQSTYTQNYLEKYTQDRDELVERLKRFNKSRQEFAYNKNQMIRKLKRKNVNSY